MLGDGLVGQANAFAEEQQFMQMWAHQGVVIPTVKPVDWFEMTNAHLLFALLTT